MTVCLGYDNEDDNTWEPVENLDCADKILEFNSKAKKVNIVQIHTTYWSVP